MSAALGAAGSRSFRAHGRTPATRPVPVQLLLLRLPCPSPQLPAAFSSIFPSPLLLRSDSSQFTRKLYLLGCLGRSNMVAMRERCIYAVRCITSTISAFALEQAVDESLRFHEIRRTRLGEAEALARLCRPRLALGNAMAVGTRVLPGSA